MSSDISFDMVFDTARIRLEPGSKRSNAMEDNKCKYLSIGPQYVPGGTRERPRLDS